MCIIADEIESVSKTKIFVATNPTKTRQITVYSNFVNSVVNNNAMILPIPSSQNVDFIDLSNYKDIFDDCKSSFYDLNFSLGMRTKSFSMNSKNILPVFNVGSYQVSLALNFEQLSNVNKNVFQLRDDLKKMLYEFYSNPNWGFIICKLSKGPEEYHPFAYSHNIVDNKLFMPTRHFHVESTNKTQINNNMWMDGTSMSNYSFINTNTNTNTNTNAYKKIADDWEHDIYIVNFDINKNQYITQFNSCKDVWSNENNVNYSKIRFNFDKCNSFTKLVINGTHPNIDIICTL